MHHHLTHRQTPFLMALLALALPAVALAENPSPSGDPFLGAYKGEHKVKGREACPVEGAVITEGPGLYRITVSLDCPWAGGAVGGIELHGQAAGPRVLAHGFSQSVFWDAALQDGKLRIKGQYGSVMELEKYIAHSPTELADAPKSAVVLLPYKAGKKADLSAWTNQEWEALPDGVMQVKPGSGANYTKAKFGDMRLHMEFRLPHMGMAHGQGRANSGIYVENRYEVQILDSFAVSVSAGDCGAIYELAVPRANACYPPGQWQTYDIEFHAPRLKSDGSVAEDARISVKHNGVTIHKDQVLKKESPGGIDKPAEKDCFRLQDHGNHLQFRNIWLLEPGKKK